MIREQVEISGQAEMVERMLPELASIITAVLDDPEAVKRLSETELTVELRDAGTRLLRAAYGVD